MSLYILYIYLVCLALAMTGYVQQRGHFQLVQLLAGEVLTSKSWVISQYHGVLCLPRGADSLSAGGKDM